MYKNARILIVLLSAVFLFSACSRKQAPSPVTDGLTGTGSQSGLSGQARDFGGEYVPESGLEGGWGDTGDLEVRGSGDGISNGMYKGREMVKGVLPPVYFGFDSSAIPQAERGKLQQAAEYLEANPSMALLIEGHCDWYGTAEYNLALDDRRAESASNYLGTLGITPLRIDKLSKGSLEATTGLSKSEAAEDRRADLILLK